VGTAAFYEPDPQKKNPVPARTATSMTIEVNALIFVFDTRRFARKVPKSDLLN